MVYNMNRSRVTMVYRRSGVDNAVGWSIIILRCGMFRNRHLFIHSHYTHKGTSAPSTDTAVACSGSQPLSCSLRITYNNTFDNIILFSTWKIMFYVNLKIKMLILQHFPRWYLPSTVVFFTPYIKAHGSRLIPLTVWLLSSTLAYLSLSSSSQGSLCNLNLQLLSDCPFLSSFSLSLVFKMKASSTFLWNVNQMFVLVFFIHG